MVLSPMVAFVCLYLGRAIECVNKALDAKLRSPLEIVSEWRLHATGNIYPIVHIPRNHSHSFAERHAKQSVRI